MVLTDVQGQELDAFSHTSRPAKASGVPIARNTVATHSFTTRIGLLS